MTVIWVVLGGLAVAILGAVTEVVVKDFTKHKFPSIADWWGSFNGQLARVCLLSLAMLVLASLSVFMASTETTTGNKTFLWGLAAVCLLVAVSQVLHFRRDPRRSRS